MGLFAWRRKRAADTADTVGLGHTLIALRLVGDQAAPGHSTVVAFNAAGQARRVAGGRVAHSADETVFCFHPGPYTVDLQPFAAAPEWGLRLRYVIDAANPRVAQQRFDLYLFSEAGARLAAADLGAAMQVALQTALAQGGLDLPPCTSLEEWHAFRAGLNELLYTRFGVTVDDCVPVDLGDRIDFAEVLRARASAAAVFDAALDEVLNEVLNEALNEAHAAHTAHAAEARGAAGYVKAGDTTAAAMDSVAQATDAAPVAAGAPPQAGAAAQDARALRRLFLELPALSSGLRLLAVPEGLTIFQQHQALLLRLHMASLNVGTMPALAWAAPDQPLGLQDQAVRARHSALAAQAMDEAWALLARCRLAAPAQWLALMDEADRICANLETGLALRRQTTAPVPPVGQTGASPTRVEPSL